MARDLLKEILDNYNVTHRYQKRLINRAGHGDRLLPTTRKKDFLRRETIRRAREDRLQREALTRSADIVKRENKK